MKEGNESGITKAR